MDIQKQNKIVVGTYGRLQRFLINGMKDTTFNEVLYNYIPKVVIDKNDNILIVARMGYCHGFAFLDPNGYYKSSFACPNLGYSEFNSLAIQDSNHFLVAGYGSFIQDSSSIFRIDYSGDIDTTFLLDTTHRANDLLCLANGKILVGGNYAPTSNPTFYRLLADGQRDTSFNIGTGFDSTVHELRILNQNKILVIGKFHSYNDTMVKSIVLLNEDMGTALDRIEKINTKIFPIPANKMFRINTDATFLQIFDIHGKLIKEVKSIIPNQDLVITDLQPGFYFVTCYKNYYSETFKVVVN